MKFNAESQSSGRHASNVNGKHINENFLKNILPYIIQQLNDKQMGEMNESVTTSSPTVPTITETTTVKAKKEDNVDMNEVQQIAKLIHMLRSC